jgi:DNA excision repair protein ERCC-6
VNLKLPSKAEQVLFCYMTDTQKNLYKEYIKSPDVERVLKGDFQVSLTL